MRLIARRLHILFVLVFVLVGFGAFSQIHDGFTIREVPMDPAVAATIQTEAGFTQLPRCWRVYVCVSNPNFELQAIASLYDVDNATQHPFSVICPGCSGTDNFYQNTTFGGVLASDANPALYPFYPELEYDSWFFIGEGDLQNGNVSYISDSDPAFDPSIDFENGDDFVDLGLETTDGTVVFAPSVGTDSPGLPDGEYKVLIGQFTTDGVFNGVLTLQFRELNPDGTILVPTNVVRDFDATFTNDPSFIDLVCPQVFLPVALLAFDVAASDDRVNILWETASEQNVEKFIVEHSLDMENWKSVAEEFSKGAPTSTQSYFAAHTTPEPGVNYYRLKEIDQDGTISVNDPRSVVYKPENFTFFPNPTSERVWFKGDLSLVSSIRICDMRGKVVLSQSIGTDPIREIDVNGLDTGSYILEFYYPNGDARRETLEIVRR